MVRRTEKGDATSSWVMEKDVSGGESEWIVGWTGCRRVWCGMSGLVWVHRRCESRNGNEGNAVRGAFGNLQCFESCLALRVLEVGHRLVRSGGHRARRH